MRAQTIVILLLVSMFVGCIAEKKPDVEYECWDGTIVSDLSDCPRTTTSRVTSSTTTTTTTTTTTKACSWTAASCRKYCSASCGKKPLEYCDINQTTCDCRYVCGTTTTAAETTTTTTLALLTNKEIDAAINWGEDNMFTQDKMITAYTYPNDSIGYEHVVIYTPYLKLAIKAGDEKREYREIDEATIGKIVGSDEIMFRVKLYGNTKEFNSDISAVIKLRNEVIQPTKITPDESPETTAYWPKAPAYFAVNTYVFPSYSSIRDREIRFIVIRRDREDTYTIDMSDYK